MKTPLRMALAIAVVAGALAGAVLPWRASAQTPGPAPSAAGASPSGAPTAPAPVRPSGETLGPSGVPVPGTPGVPPGPPPTPANGEWNLSDLVDGIIKMESASLPLTHEQAEKVRPSLQRVLEATAIMSETEARIKQVLTKEQMAFIESRRQAGELPPDAGLGAPKKPGEDPVVARVLEILEARAK